MDRRGGERRTREGVPRRQLLVCPAPLTACARDYVSTLRVLTARGEHKLICEREREGEGHAVDKMRERERGKTKGTEGDRECPNESMTDRWGRESVKL